MSSELGRPSRRATARRTDDNHPPNVTTASRTLLLFVAALSSIATPVAANDVERNSEPWPTRDSVAWSPQPPAPWAPSAAWSPPVDESSHGDCEPSSEDASYRGGWNVRSQFQPMLGRYGVVAPTTTDSCHENGPVVDPHSQLSTYRSDEFSPDPFYDHIPWDSCVEKDVYGGKYLNPVQRPLVELGMPLYLNGPVPPPTLEFGETNPSLKRFYVYGDYRAALAYNAQQGSDLGVLAQRLNLELDYWLTATERFHAFVGPLQEGGSFNRLEFDDGDVEYREELDLFDEDTDTLFFEGDLGAIVGGLTGRYAPFDLPIAAGLIPLVFQNGIWMEDAIVGVAATIPARNSPALDWSNYDITFFCGFDELESAAFGADDSTNVFGATTFIEAKGGYLEAGYAFLDDSALAGRSYHNVGVSYTRRYLNLVSNSLRAIVNTGQDGAAATQTADGVLLLVENSFLTPWPYNVIPYLNLFVGFDDPQSVARAGAAGGVLRNTGILFESDNLTGFPTLDATANDTYGAAIGLDLLAHDFSQQLVLEAAVLQAFGDPALRNAPGDQYGVGVRYQVPISYRFLIRFDVMHGWLENADDLTGARTEFRWKF